MLNQKSARLQSTVTKEVIFIHNKYHKFTVVSGLISVAYNVQSRKPPGAAF